MSSPNEIAEKKKQERLAAQREMEKKQKNKAQAKATRNKSDPTPSVPGIKPTITATPVQDPMEQQDLVSGSTVNDSQGKTIEKQINESTGRQKGKGSKQVEMTLIKQEKWYQENVVDPIEATAQKRKQAAETAKAEGRDLEAGVSMSAYAATKAGKGFLEGLTFAVRPKAWEKAIVQTGDLITDKPQQVKSDQQQGYLESEKVGTQTLAVEGIQADPVGFVAEAGGNILGGKVAGDLAGLGYDKITGTQKVKVTQLESVSIKDVDDFSPVNVPDSELTISQQSIKTEITPTIKTQTKRVPLGVFDDIDNMDDFLGKSPNQAPGKPDTLLGTAEGQGFKLGLNADQVDDLFKGKTVKTGSAKGELIGVSDDYKPFVGLDDAKTNPLSDKKLKTAYKTTGKEMFKEFGEGSPFDNSPPQTTVKGSQVKMDVTGTTKLFDDVPDELPIKPSAGKKSPWDLFDQQKAVKGTQKILKDGPPEPPRAPKGLIGESKQTTNLIGNTKPSTQFTPLKTGTPTFSIGAGVGSLTKVNKSDLISDVDTTQIDAFKPKQTPKTIIGTDQNLNQGLGLGMGQGNGQDTKVTPIVIPNPPIVTPIVIPIPDVIPKPVPPKPATITIPEEGTKPAPPIFPGVTKPKNPPKPFKPFGSTQKQRRARNPLVGFEDRSYGLTGLFGSSKKKKKGGFRI